MLSFSVERKTWKDIAPLSDNGAVPICVDTKTKAKNGQSSDRGPTD